MFAPVTHTIKLVPVITEAQWIAAHNNADLSKYLNKFLSWEEFATFVLRINTLGRDMVLSYITPPTPAEAPTALLANPDVFTKFSEHLATTHLASQPKLIHMVTRGAEACIAAASTEGSPEAICYKGFFDGLIATKSWVVRDGLLVHAEQERALLSIYDEYIAEHSAALKEITAYVSVPEDMWLMAYVKIKEGVREIAFTSEDGTTSFYEPAQPSS